VYQASYVSGRWSGDLKAYVATTAGVADEPVWEASTGIPAVRNILTHDGAESAGGSDGAVFPTAAQVAALDESARSHAPATGAQVAAYIAGDQSREAANGGNLRNRTTTVLGDIANSSPIYVEDNNTLFVGANDGMLHAIDADDGTEIFAYVPKGIDLDALASTSDPRYGTTVVHKYFVDGPIAVSAKSQTPGKNYLVGALGRGGKGVFGLDVTDPENFGTGDVLWENSGDTDMGMVLGDPLVVKLNDVDGTMAAVVSNGINSTTGSAVLFVMDLATGQVLQKIDTGATGANGLSAPRGADTDGNGTVDYVYAGDLAGNLWKFDLTSIDAANWRVANAGAPLLVARDDNGVRQPITAGLALARHPQTGDIWVFAGTGSFITASDLTDDDVQTVYGIIDDGTVVDGRTSAGDLGDLVERDILVVGTSAAGQPIRAFEPPQQTLEVGRRGWFIDLDDPTEGERIVSGLRILGSTLIASSIIPPTGSTCDAGGSGYINAIDAFTGVSTGQPFFDLNADGVVNDDDRIATTIDGETVYLPGGSIDLGIGMPTRPTVIDKLLVVGGSTGEIGSVTINPQGIGARRISWREILGG
jgi:type IV pilus assembly protein PilY1